MIKEVKQAQRKLFEIWLESINMKIDMNTSSESIDLMWEAWQAAQDDCNDIDSYLMKEYRKKYDETN